jgi:integrase
MIPRTPHPPLVQAWLDRCDRQLKPKTAGEYRRLVNKHLLPALGHLPPDRITRAHVRECIDAIPSRDVARCALIVARSFFSWAISEGHLDLPANPCAGLKRGRSTTRDRVLSLPELAAIWHAVARMGDYGRAIRLLVLTGCRRQEIGGLVWSEVDLAGKDGPCLRLPPARVKNGRSHMVPLAPLALAQLPAPRPGFPNLFGRIQGVPFDGWGICKGILDAKLGGMQGPWVVHDLRRSFVTHANELGLAPPWVIEACVNHLGSRAGVAGTYNRAGHLAARRAALERWADELARLTGLATMVPSPPPIPDPSPEELARVLGALRNADLQALFRDAQTGN